MPRKRGEGPAQRVRAPSARMQHCDKAGPNAGLGTKGERATGTGHLHQYLTFQITKQRTSQPSPQRMGLRMDYTSRPAQGAREPKTRWRHRPTPSILPRCFPPRWHAKILHAIAAQVPPKKQKPSWEGTRTRVCAPRPPRALTYRLRPCRRTRTLADTRLKTQKPQRSDASSTEQTRRLGRGFMYVSPPTFREGMYQVWKTEGEIWPDSYHSSESKDSRANRRETYQLKSSNNLYNHDFSNKQLQFALQDLPTITFTPKKSCWYGLITLCGRSEGPRASKDCTVVKARSCWEEPKFLWPVSLPLNFHLGRRAPALNPLSNKPDASFLLH